MTPLRRRMIDDMTLHGNPDTHKLVGRNDAPIGIQTPTNSSVGTMLQGDALGAERRSENEGLETSVVCDHST